MISGKDLEGWINAPDPLAAMEKAQNQAYYRDRRERIATAAMKALLSGPPPDRITYGQLAQHAVYCADALIAELDKEVKP